MASDTVGTQRKWGLPLILGLLVGVAIGLFLGWQVLPVRWYNTDPSDLRVEHQTDYVAMVADSLAVTGSPEIAQQRLRELTDADTTWEQVADLVQRSAMARKNDGDEATALRIQRMSQMLNLTAVPSAPFEAPRREVAIPSRSILYLAAVGAFIIALAILVWLLIRMAQGRQARPSAPEVSLAGAAGGMASGGAPETWLRAPDAIAEEALEVESDEDEDLDEEDVAPVAVEELEEEDFEELDEDDLEEVDLEDLEPAEGPVAASAPALHAVPPERQADALIEEAVTEVPPDALGVFEAEYRYGDDDFDCSFSIESAEGEFLGECGVGISDVLGGEDAQQVSAFEVWLFDKGDIRTVSQILVSEYAYGDEALRARLSAKGELLLAQPGLEIHLETQSLQVTAAVRSLSYEPDDQLPGAYFAQLNIELVAEKADEF